MLSEALRLIRVFHDLKQADAAERLGVSKSYLSEVESGKKTPSMDVIGRYAEVFELPRSSILFFAEALEPDAKLDVLDRARGIVAEKVLDFLRIVERKKVLP